jgi:hypothetical protein
MAADHHNHDAPAMDYAEHEKTFNLFAVLMKWGTVLSVVLLLLAGSMTGVLPWIFTLVVSALMTAVVVKFF